MYPAYTLRILGGKGGCGGHGIAAMRRDDLLVGFEPAVRSALAPKLRRLMFFLVPDSRAA